MKIFVIAVVLFFCSFESFAQANKQKDEYRQVVNKRAEKIVATLDIADSARFLRVRDAIATQYVNLNAIQTTQENRIKLIRQKTGTDKSSYDAEMKIAEDQLTQQLDSLHKIYMASLAKELNSGQIEKVKDGMTYGVLPLTYKGYQEMIPQLTNEQKARILELLTEAREKAMDAGSSEEKHKWFGKYKGRINNYLSAQGYDLKKASKEWQARIKADPD
jgi:hypothetical protein